MKAAFIFDTVIAKKENNYYGMTLNYDFFKNRYLTIYDSIIVSTRVKDAENIKGIEGYKKLNGNGVVFLPITDYKEIPDALRKRKKIIDELENVIDQVDVVIIRMPSVLGSLACNICKKKRKKYVIEMVACALDGYRNHRNPMGKAIAPIMFLVTRKCVKNAPNVIYVTEKFLQKRYPTKGKQCSCSDVVLSECKEDCLKNRIEKIEKFNIKKMKICTVANVEMKYKGHIYVLKAIKKLKKYGFDITYYLIGNGDTSYLMNKAKKMDILENVIFTGSLSHREVFEKLKEMYIYIQPSLQEGLPRALIEAMSIGLPAIGSNAGGIPELLNKKMIFKVKKTNQLINIIKNINKVELEKEANYNFIKASYYKPGILNNLRNEFYKNI